MRYDNAGIANSAITRPDYPRIVCVIYPARAPRLPDDAPPPAYCRLAKRRIGETMEPTSRPNGEAASANITQRIQELGDWRGETLAHVRQLIHDADADIQEEWKWEKPSSPGIPVWSHDGGVCTG